MPAPRDPPQSPKDSWGMLLPNTPSYMEEGVYDAFGRRLGNLTDRVANGRVYIEFAGVTFIWAVFNAPLRPGQRGDMLFTNIPGTAPITPFFTEWDMSSGFPRIGSALFTLIAAQRSNGAAKVGAGALELAHPVHHPLQQASREEVGRVGRPAEHERRGVAEPPLDESQTH